jgi:integrase/recombinase XerD
MVKKYGRKAGLAKNASIHGIRRSMATHLLKNGAHPLYIQRLLGHASTKTMNRYIKVTAVDIKRTHEKTHPRQKDCRRESAKEKKKDAEKEL